MKCTRHEHGDVLPRSVRRHAEQLELILREATLSKRSTLRDFRREFLTHLAKSGWARSVRVSSGSKIKITAQLDRTALCFQTGNVSRFYADLLKVQALSKDGRIDGAILIVPTMDEARRIGSNVANYDRLLRELVVFRKVITAPVVLIGVERI